MKWLSGLYVIILAMGLMLVIKVLTSAKKSDKIYFQSQWKNIVAMSKDEKSMAMSLIAADKLLHAALLKKGYSGNTTGEKMKQAKADFSDNNSIWTAHKLRNSLVHDMDSVIPKSQVKKALISYQTALHDLGVI